MEDNGDKKEDRIRARSDTDIGTSPEEPPTKKNPSYGSQKYWEDRYTSHQAVDQNGTEENSSDAFHSWYFTYDDLSPLILPLILGEGGDGGEDCEDHNVAGHEPPALASNNCGSGNSAENTEDSKGSSSSREHEVTPLDDGQCQAYATSGGNENAKDGRDTTDDFSEHSADTGDEEASFEDFVEVVDEDDGSANSEPPKPREGLSKLGPVSVLEIGCGDVPLGRNLAKSIDLLASQTGVPSNSILKQVVCIDYAPACIAALKKEQRSTDGQKIQVCYEVGDARKLKYKNESFELILEKGTMDAMLSDDDEGVENCRLIVAESARILSTGGYIVVVSHLNAHVKSGLQWLDRIIVPGLRMNCKTSSWEIEVHGNSGADTSVNDGEDELQESPGPAVYIIHKMMASTEVATASDPPTIPLKFFSY